MCGVAGIFAYGADAPPVDRAQLLRIREAMTARGPDGEGIWLSDDGRVGLAHRRLAIIDPNPSGAQPMASADGRHHIVFNGEIYNYKALREQLVQQGRDVVSDSDTEVLLHLYARDGADMVETLRGMFAFALWDAEKRGLLLARDPFGIKPLYVADDGATVRVASQVKALLAGGDIDTRTEAAGRVGFYLWGTVPEPFTLYRGIQAHPPGRALWIDHAGRRTEKVFADISAEIGAAEAAAREQPPAVGGGALYDMLSDSVRHHMVADVPVGAFLSSGLDSATLVALAAEDHGAGLRTVTLAFDEFRDTPNDEAPLAETIAGRYGTAHRTVRVAASDFSRDYDALLTAMDQPSIDGVNTYFVAKATAESGLKVALSGIGGDEMFGGYDTFRKVPKLVRALAPLRPLRGGGRLFRVVAGPVIRHLASPKYAGLFEYGTTYGDAYLLRRGLYMPWELPQMLDPDLVREGWAALMTRERLAETVSGLDSPVLKVAALECGWYLRNQLLRDADWAGMAHSLEIRVPLVDLTLFRRLMPHRAAPTPPGKGAMARAPRTPLPDAVLARRKSGFFIPVDRWLTREDTAKQPLEPGLRGWAKLLMAEAVAG